jgi:hypothetical protein
LLEETKQRQRLQQEARTIAKLEQLEIEICEKLGGELECLSNTDTARQYTLSKSDNEEDLVEEQDSSSTIKSEL